MKWIYMYKVCGDITLYGNLLECRSFNEAVKMARSICRASGVSLVGVMPCSVVDNHAPCVFNLK